MSMINRAQGFFLSSVLAASLVSGVHAATPAPEGAAVYFVTPLDGQTVNSPVTVSFGLEGLGVAPAGVERERTGHHHLLVDVDDLPALDQPVPADEHHIHFGGGQTQTTLKLSPGKHTLQLLVGDHLHVPHEPPVMSEKITITVE
ncbi:MULTISPECIES: DUF4399 domain-containing protein [Marinobacter]|uniref:Rod shape-determining protein RodA n=1 Tax=Marinobacter profundi TaxID=2666256 RepID=A0A2G1UN98_9GAMM|nr:MULTISPECIES: DUF4399 domain-containing protein [Marinobacter]MBD3655018.1 DUF4399 domain-containing protein [Marinobacter sp.]PHQ15933.1 rod shape-determining protein RodA [Marinobacter profundi]